MNTEGQRKRPCGSAENRKGSPWDAEEEAWKWPYTHLEQTKIRESSNKKWNTQPLTGKGLSLFNVGKK